MKFLILVLAVACAYADVSHLKNSDDVNAPIVKSSVDIQPEGSYHFEYETGNGIAAQEDGVLKSGNSEYPSIEVKGNVKYTAPDGTPVDLSYIADENGFQPQGSHLPVAPPIPEYIARSIEYIAAHPPPVSVESARKFP